MWPTYCPVSIFHPQPDHMYQWNDWTSECKPIGSLSSSVYLNSHIFCFDFLFLKSGSSQKELINYLNLIIYYVFPESTWAFFQNSPFPQLDFLYLFFLPALPTSSICLSRMMGAGWLLARTGTEFSCALTFHLSLRLRLDHSSDFTYCDFSQVTSVSSQLCKAPWPQISRHLELPRFQSPKLLFTSLLAASHDYAPTVYPFFTYLPSHTLSYQACF